MWAHEFWCQQRPEEDDRAPGAGAAGMCERSGLAGGN